jgi:hypothetical protein
VNSTGLVGGCRNYCVSDTRNLLEKLCEEFNEQPTQTDTEQPQQAETVTVRACGACEKEFGKIPVPQNVSISHGYCTRHYKSLYGQYWPADRVSPVPDLEPLSPEQRVDWRVATKPFEQADREYERSKRTAMPANQL